jgi:glycosyltransferase involved in cell wall biosynthesis
VIGAAGVLVHPALHDEAGLAVAEALAMGTPVVCLDHGGPAEVVRRYPSSPSTLVSPGRPAETGRRLAAAIDAFLDRPPPIPQSPLTPDHPFAESLLAAYDRAAGGSAGG